MDIFAHTLWATVASKKLNDSLEEKNKQKISVLWSAFWGIFPDLFAFTIPSILSIYSFIFSGKNLLEFFNRSPHLSIADPTFKLASYLYQYSHSIIIFLVVFCIVWIIFKRPQIAMLGWLLHIIIDIPSHSLEFFPTPFLFPISDYRFSYGIMWSNQWFMIINYSLLLIFFGYFLLRKRKTPKV